MTTNDKKLGERIRELRTRLGITQKELAGDKITRNMLSLIESGNASPSVSTLLYIAERLGTSAGYFFTSTEEDEGRYFKLSVIDELKTSFREKNYNECENLLLSIPHSAWDDELSYIAAVSYLHTALEYAKRFDIARATSDLTQAGLYADNSIYTDDSFEKAVTFYGELLRTLCSDVIPECLCDDTMCGAYVPITMIRYFRALSIAENGGGVCAEFGENAFYEKHVLAVSMIYEKRMQDAIKLLRELSLDSALPYYMKYRVLCGLENSANGIGDFRTAYSASRRKLELINGSGR